VIAIVALGSALVIFVLVPLLRDESDETAQSCEPGIRNLPDHPRGTRAQQLAVNGDGRDRAIHLVDVDRGPLRDLKARGFIQTWAPDGQRFAYTLGTELYIANVNGSSDENVGGGLSAAWSPDAVTLALGLEGVELLNLDTRQQRRISKVPSFPIDLSWAPSGKCLVVGSGLEGIWLVSIDGSDVRQLTRGGFDFGPSWSPDGRWIAYTHSDQPGKTPRSIFLVRPDGTGLRKLTDGFNDQAPSWSPDGKRIAFERQPLQRRGQPPEARHYHIHVVDVATGRVKEVETPGGRGRVPVWRPFPR
jgi:Tol biopolymer transport system component